MYSQVRKTDIIEDEQGRMYVSSNIPVDETVKFLTEVCKRLLDYDRIIKLDITPYYKKPSD